MDSAGKLNLSTNAAVNGPLNATKGGTGLSALTLNKVLIGDGTDTAFLGSGLIYQGPTSTGAGSTAAHEGTVTISSSQALSGIHFYTDFTLNAGQTLTIADDAGRLCICATGTITINGTIDGVGAGAAGGTSMAAGVAVTYTHQGGPGWTNPGGGGGSGGGGSAQPRAGDGGATPFTKGGLGNLTGGNNGAQGLNQTGELIGISHPFSIGGGAGGGAGGGGNTGTGGAGGRGGGSITLFAPTIVLGAASVFNTSGAAGSNGTSTVGGGGGGGSAGNVTIFCRSLTDNGATFTLTAGAGGTGDSTGGNGGAGRAGVKQILIYA